MKLLRIIGTGFDIKDQQLIRYWMKKWEYNETVHQLFIDILKAYDSVRRGVLYNILIHFGASRLIKMCLNETYSKVPTGKHLS
jgi:hypothetical protein